MARTRRVIAACLASVAVFVVTWIPSEQVFKLDRELALALAGAALAVAGIPIGLWVSHGEKAGPPTIRRGLWAMEAKAPSDVPRPELTDRIVALIQQADGGTVGLTTALLGAGGFGKTNLARQVCSDPRVREHFVAGVWASVGQRPTGSELTTIVNDLYYQLTGHRPDIANPDQAGAHLGQLLNGSDRVLIVLDDIWREEQLRPFLRGGRYCTRLITTRRPGLLMTPASGVKVDELSTQQANELLAADLPVIDHEYLNDLLRLTGRWPLLVQLANRHLLNSVNAQVAINRAAGNLVGRLQRDGPGALDLADEVSRDRAAAASINASLDLMVPSSESPVDGRVLFRQLGIFAEDNDIDLTLVAALWNVTAGLDTGQVDRVCDRLYGLSLITEYRPGISLRLHDVIRAFLRVRSGDELRSLNVALLEAAHSLLRPSDAFRVLPNGKEPSGSDGPEATPWWRLPERQSYLWQNLCWHLVEAGMKDELTALQCDLRWAQAKIWRFGLPALDTDLALGDDQTVVTFRQAIEERRQAFKFSGGATEWSVAEAIVEKLRSVPRLEGMVAAYLSYLPDNIRSRYKAAEERKHGQIAEADPSDSLYGEY